MEPLGRHWPIAGEDCKKAEEENGRLADKRLALVMELGTVKDEFATFREKAAADRETMDAEFDSSGDALFNYGYGCCGRLADERLALVMELGTVKDEFAAFREKATADRETMEAEFDSNGDGCLITALVVAFSRKTFAGASLRSRMECQILHSYSPKSSLPTPLPPKHLVSRSSPRSNCRQRGGASGD